MVSYRSICVAIVAASRSFALPLAYPNPLLGRDIGGTLFTGPLTAVGDLVGLGSGFVAVGNAGAGGHISRDIGGVIDLGSILAGGNIPSIAGGLVSVAGLDGSGHIGSSNGLLIRSPFILGDGAGGVFYTPPVVGAGSVPGLASGALAVGNAGATGFVGRSEDDLVRGLDHSGGTVETGNVQAAGDINRVAGGVVDVDGAGASGHRG